MFGLPSKRRAFYPILAALALGFMGCPSAVVDSPVVTPPVVVDTSDYGVPLTLVLADSSTKAGVWTSKGLTVLDSGAATSNKATFAVNDNGKIYAIGTDSGLDNALVVWKDGVRSRLALPSSLSSQAARCLQVVGGSVYILVFGVDSTSGKSVSGYWKDDTYYSLQDNGYGSIPSAMTVSGSDVYVLGSCTDATNTTSVVGYWTSTTSFVALSNPPANFGPSGIYVSGGDIYITGSAKTNSYVLKNGAIVTTLALPAGYDPLSAYAGGQFFAMLGSELYVAGSIDSGLSESGIYPSPKTTATSGTVAAIWKISDNSVTVLNPLVDGNSIALRGIQVAQGKLVAYGNESSSVSLKVTASKDKTPILWLGGEAQALTLGADYASAYVGGAILFY